MRIKKCIAFTLMFVVILTGFSTNVNAASKISMSRTTISNIVNQKYTGKYIEPDVIVRYNGEKLKEGTDYTVSYSNNKNAGTATAKVTGKGNFSGSKKVYFKIVGTTTSSIVTMSKVTVKSIPNQKYTGKYIEPDVTVTYNGEELNEGTDYTVSYSNNKKVGYAQVKVTGKGIYSGSKTVSFRIVSNESSSYYDDDISISKTTVSTILNQAYTGKYIEPDVTVRYDGEKLEEGTDYTLSYSNNKNVGTAKVTIKGKGNFYGSKTVTFKIVKSSNSSSVSGSISMNRVTLQRVEDQVYTGKYIKPEVVLTYDGEELDEGTDYTVTYSDNKNVGYGKIYIKGKGDFSGSKTVYFKIEGKNISISKTTVSTVLNQKYTGSYIKPSVVVRYDGEKLEEGTDYTLSYSNNKNVGTARITIKGKGNYTGSKTVTFKIVGTNNDYDDEISISEVSVSRVLNRLYTGSYIKPSVVIRYKGEKLKEGTDYTLSYSNNKNVGTAKITIKGKGNFSGTKTVTFKILER